MFTAAAIQMDCVDGYQKKNLSRAENFVLEAVDAGAKLIALPELFSTGAFDFRKEDLSELMYHKTTRFLRGLAENNGVHVAGSFIEKVSNGRRNTTILCGPRGIMGTYHKVYLWKAEVPFLKPGNEFPVAETELGRVGIMTCYDIAFPEAGRTLGRKRADMVVSGSARKKPWTLIMPRTRAPASCTAALVPSAPRRQPVNRNGGPPSTAS